MEGIWLILILGGVTYITRASGHLIVSQFGQLHPRVSAALDAVPAAVITAIVVPPVLDGGFAERAAFAIALLVGIRLSMIPTLIIGVSTLAVARLILN